MNNTKDRYDSNPGEALFFMGDALCAFDLHPESRFSSNVSISRTVNLPPVSDFIDVRCGLIIWDSGLIILDGIHYPAVLLANAVLFLGREFLGALRPRIISQGLDAFDNLCE
jgi:hypothetical protein